MPDCLVTCINKQNRQSEHEHITHIGNTANNWRLTREEAIRRIEAKIDTFYTLDGATGKRSNVAVVREVGKAPFLRTYADGQWNNNLLAQPECSSACNIIG
jgi:hypothetical protein